MYQTQHAIPQSTPQDRATMKFAEAKIRLRLSKKPAVRSPVRFLSGIAVPAFTAPMLRSPGVWRGFEMHLSLFTWRAMLGLTLLQCHRHDWVTGSGVARRIYHRPHDTIEVATTDSVRGRSHLP
jgi:hypothetical protein